MRLVTMIMLTLVLAGVASAANGDAALQLWYDQPANTWLRALPIGNGRLGAMIFGGVDQDRVQLNEDSLWTGEPQDADNPASLEALPEVQRLQREGRLVEAEKLVERSMVCKGEGSHQGDGADYPYGSYQSLGDLWWRFDHGGALFSDYRRAVDLDTAVASVTYTAGGVRFSREIFSSAPDQVIVIRLTADKPGAISFDLGLNRDERNGSRPWNNDSGIAPPDFSGAPPKWAAAFAAPDRLDMAGRVWGDRGMAFCAAVRVLPEGGAVVETPAGLSVEKADAATILLAANTDYRGGDPASVCATQIDAAAAKSYATLRDAHVADYQGLFRRVALDLGGSDAAATPTDDRLKALKRGTDDPALCALYFQFGRYLLISSSRPGTLPANLQGLWCDNFHAPWNCDYHSNINLQMNYWPAEVMNLAECAEPLFRFIDSLREPGRKTARIHYGAGGWVTHTIGNVWGFTSPGEHPSWGQFHAAAGWLCRHLWEHYAYGGDRAFLEFAYPIMKEAAQFYVDFLIEEPKHGWLVTSPSNSPENAFRMADGSVARVCMGPTMDMEIIRDLYTNCIHASEILGVDAEFRQRLQADIGRLAPLQIGRYGQLQEWLEDYEEPEPGHRHMSHLYALHPGEQITVRGTPDLAQAVRVTLDRRLSNGGGHTGWSRAWIINFFARLEDGARAHENLVALLQKSTVPNLFDNHPPFQIDGNFGAAAGIAEMLLQSHAGDVHLLPALPAAWPEGRVTGLRARGGFTVDVAWRGGRLSSGAVAASLAGPCRIRVTCGVRIFEDGAEVTCERPEPDVAVFEAKAGGRYELKGENS